MPNLAKYLFRGGCMAIFLSVTACGSMPLLPVSDVFTSTHCNILKPDVVEIDNAEMLNAVIQKSQSNFLDAKQLAVPKVNFDSTKAYLISMGNRPTAGYSIQLQGNEATLKDGVVRLPVALVEPGKVNVAQVITSPCKIVVLPKGDYTRVELEKL